MLRSSFQGLSQVEQTGMLGGGGGGGGGSVSSLFCVFFSLFYRASISQRIRILTVAQVWGNKSLNTKITRLTRTVGLLKVQETPVASSSWCQKVYSHGKLMRPAALRCLCLELPVLQSLSKNPRGSPLRFTSSTL